MQDAPSVMSSLTHGDVRWAGDGIGRARTKRGRRVRALDGIRVIDLTEALAGPYCTMILGDLGADVIKIERPGVGDQSRKWGPPFIGTESAYYLSVNRNKRSAAIDIGSSEGQAIMRKLLERADVFV